MIELVVLLMDAAVSDDTMRLKIETNKGLLYHNHGFNCNGCVEMWQAGYSAALLYVLHKANVYAKVEARMSFTNIEKNSKLFDKHMENIRKGLM